INVLGILGLLGKALSHL
uniref:Bombolitin-5 n=2 Tax=Bombus TaxID=28641 RepID=BOL5_BOMPE|nr:RecName: Full=Bombolitin-5; AltName: Full=Bombolitin V [Bombus pensylvanicus]